MLPQPLLNQAVSGDIPLPNLYRQARSENPANPRYSAQSGKRYRFVYALLAARRSPFQLRFYVAHYRVELPKFQLFIGHLTQDSMSSPVYDRCSAQAYTSYMTDQNANEFAPGDVVQLKSGGPRMTVERVGKDSRTQEDAVFCTWFETVGKRQECMHEAFAPAVLAKAGARFGQVRLVRG